MTMAWSIVKTRVREHCADKCMEHCDEKDKEPSDDMRHGALL